MTMRKMATMEYRSAAAEQVSGEESCDDDEENGHDGVSQGSGNERGRNHDDPPQDDECGRGDDAREGQCHHSLGQLLRCALILQP